MHSIDLHKFDLNLLAVFDALMREQHVGRAGELLGLTQPAVSHALGRLRHLLDDPLFVRHDKGVRPTARAAALADAIAPALRILRASLRQGDEFDPAAATRANSPPRSSSPWPARLMSETQTWSEQGPTACHVGEPRRRVAGFHRGEWRFPSGRVASHV